MAYQKGHNGGNLGGDYYSHNFIRIPGDCGSRTFTIDKVDYKVTASYGFVPGWQL